ncbi:MAG: PorP/SprF family type IX secretion system membrane protein [Saprospiraceae bacterium]
MKPILLTLFFTCATLISWGQDAHFSQMDLNTSLRNPANLGDMEAMHRLSLSYRSQWSSIPSPYRNISLGYEQQRGAFAFGMHLLQNDAGTASLRNTQVLVDLAYRKTISKRGGILAAGLSAGMIQQRFDPSAFQFDNQYVEGSGYDANRASQEAFQNTSQLLPSFTVGVMAREQINRIVLSGGLSFAHLNQPAATFFAASEERYPMRTSAFVKTVIPLRNKWKAALQFTWNKQGVANEKIFGLLLDLPLVKGKVLRLGLANRIADAMIVEVGMKFKRSTFALSYDWNSSSLDRVTQAKGAIELSASYQFNTKLNTITKAPEIAPATAVALAPKPASPNDAYVKDTDKDGVVDAVDECPTVPGLLRFHGCNDADGDGVWDHKDQCPNLFGMQEFEGCPGREQDADKDGILDVDDKCPFLKGNPEMQGCPDTDNDGLSDLEDYCPFLRGVKERNGCPNMNIQEHQKFVQQKTMTTIVEFDTDQSVIKQGFYQDLDEVVLFLNEHPQAQVYLSGHTDGEGNHAYNYQLGERRTQSVSYYLSEQGIPSTQISRISYGETKPKLKNTSAYEKARNRRVEVKVYLMPK